MQPLYRPESYPVPVRAELTQLSPLATEIANRWMMGWPKTVKSLLDLNEFLIQNQQATFIVEVESLSMRDAGIDLKDKLIVDRSIEPKHGDIVLALIDNDFTIKRLMIEGDKRWLQAENPDYADIHLKDGQTLLIWGVVTSVIKKFR